MAEDELRAEHDRLYKEATAAVYPLIEIHGRPAPKLNPTQEGQLRRGIGLFEQVLRINAGNWAAMWLAGKAHQRLRDFENALRCFSRSHATNPTHPDVAREAAIAAMELGRPAEAKRYCERALEAKPDDPGLIANLALATLFSGDAARARIISGDALQRDPKDQISYRILQVCEDVLAGGRACPHHVRDIL